MEITNIGKDRKERRKPVDLSTMVYGKVPPQAKDLEKAILGAIMIERGAFDRAVEILQAECFYVEAHQIIFSAAQSLSTKGQPIDILTICEELLKMEKLEIVGGPYFVTRLTNDVVSSANIEAHCRIVLEKYMAREVIRIAGEAISAAYDDSTNVHELIDNTESGIYQLSSNHQKTDFRELSSEVPKMINKIEFLQTQDETLTGVSTGFAQVDRITGGWQDTDLIILAARPSVGKTAFALNLARNAAISKKTVPVGLFSLEMGVQQLLQRMVSAGTSIRLEKIKSGRLEDFEMKQLLNHCGTLSNPQVMAPIFVDDTSSLTMPDLRSKARRMVNKFKVGLIIIDYLQLMSGGKETKGNREQEISGISRGLKGLAKDLNVPIIALSQLSRLIESRGKGQKIPQLSDLRESGAIEQDADIVGFLYRPPEDEVADDAALQNTGTLKIAKHRNGALEDIVFNVDNSVQRWTEVGVLNKPWNNTGFRPLPPTTGNDNGGATLFIQKGSKMEDDFDSGFPADENLF